MFMQNPMLAAGLEGLKITFSDPCNTKTGDQQITGNIKNINR